MDGAVTVKSCRICLETKHPDSVMFDDGVGWLEMYEFCFGLKLSVQDQPRKLCGVCANTVKKFSKFKLQAQKSDKLWKTIVNIKPMGSSEKKNAKKPSIKEECEDVYYIESTDDEADNQLAETVSELLKDEKISYEESEMVSDSELPDKNEKKSNSSDEEFILEDDDEVLDDDDFSEDVDDEDDLEFEGKDKIKKTYKCERCKIEFKRFKNYRKHTRKNNCKFRDKAAPRAPRPPQPKGSGPQEYYCGLCEMKSQDPEEIRAHFHKHSEQGDLTCKLCDFIGRDFADMVTHRYTHFLDHTTSKKYQCLVCNQRTSIPLILQFHYRKVHLKKENGGWCTVCGKEFSAYKRWRNHERLHASPQYICDKCGKKFLFRNAIIEHLVSHADSRPIICDICGKGFKRQRGLKDHMKGVHDSNKVKCTHCNKMFKNQRYLKIHLRLESKEKSYQCEICSKFFHNSYTLNKHMIWHSNDRPYRCELCGATYKVKQQLRLHVRAHVGYKPFKCLNCPKVFAQSNQLAVHASVHSGVRRHKCDYCERSFNERKLLIKHLDKAHQVTDYRLSVAKKMTEV